MSSKRSPAVRPAPRFQLKPLARALSGLAGMVPVMVWAQLPTGGQVVAGSAAINQPDANHLVVQQGSNKVIVNWQQFSIGEQGYVQFIQPGKSAVALNRVVGADPSVILGKLAANGQVFLVNPNGVVFGAGAKVDVAGLVATTMSISNEEFLSGDYRLKHGADKANGAAVVNAGTINTAEGGYVVLAGDYVDNQGVIQARAGTVLLAAGNALTLQLSGSELVDFAVDEATVVELAGVNNAGQILASGGRVIMTAKVANDLAATVVNNTGLVEARSTVEKDGVIYLTGEGGNVANAGTLDASAEASANGGYVEIRSSGDIVHQAGSVTTVSGADTGRSDAGEVYSWADGTNRFQKDATIEGRGGIEGGNGASVELSGKAVQIVGDVDVRAPKGKGGSILLDPLSITITNQDNTAAGGSTVGEQWIESQLNSGADVSILADGGAGAGIIMQDLSDGVLDGTNGGGTGGSLTLTASGAGSSITFANTANTIKVDRNLTLNANNGAGGHSGTSITVGNLVAGQGNPTGGGLNAMSPAWSAALTVDAGSVTAESLTLGKAINTNTDTSYVLRARAHDGDLTVNGNVNLAVTNSTAAAVATDVALQATGAVNVTGNVVSSATGKGYYHYLWETAGNNATTYYGAQPWSITNQRDHAIDAKLNIQAGGNVTLGAVDVRAIDQSSNFAGNGGYFQTANATQHVFWRATAADAAATIDAGGNVTVNGATSVVADGYANSSYSEIESFSVMVNEYTHVTGNQTVWEWSCSDGDCGYNSPTNYSRNDLKGSTTGNYVWSFNYTTMPGSANGSPNYTSHTDSDPRTQSGPMSYSGQAGLTATLAIAAGGDVTLNGIDNRAVNRSNTSNGSYNDANWGQQDTIDAGQSLSGSREVNYGDSFNTSFTAAPATASTTISAGDNRSVQLNGGSHVSAEHTALTASGNGIAHASMTVTAGTAGDPSGNGLITIAAPVTVTGSSSNEVHLTVTNHDGVISHADGAGTLSVNNQYNQGVARAAFISGTGAITLDDLAVNAGNEAYIDIGADQGLTLTGTTSATASSRAQIDLASVNAQVMVEDAVTATASNGVAAVTMNGKTGVSTSGITASGYTNASIALDSSDAHITTNGALAATASAATGVASIAIDGATGVTLSGNVTAQATGFGTQISSPYAIDRGGIATIDIQGGTGDVAVKGNVTANSHQRSSVDIATDAGLTLDAGKTVSATTSSSTGNTSQLVYQSDINLSGGTGLAVNGLVIASAVRGSATVDLLTTGGQGAAIAQGTGSVISASGISGSITINAGAEAPSASTGADFDLGGDIQARGTSGTATLAIKGKSGAVNNFGAVSDNNVASAAIATLGDGTEASGTLALNGTGTVTGNTDATGAQLDVTGAGSLDSSSATINIRNNNGSDSAVARATLTASGGSNTLGTIDVRTGAKGSAELTATATGDLSTAGDLSATGYQFTGDAPQSSGAATVSLTSSAGNVSLANNVTARGNANANVSVSATSGTLTQTAGTVLAHIDRGVEAEVAFASGDAMTVGGTVSALASDGIATTSLTSGAAPIDGSDALTVDGHVGANSGAGQASVLITTTGGGTASIALEQSGSIGAAGGTASSVVILSGTDDADGINAGNSADFRLDGSLSAGVDDSDPQYGRAGTAQITVAGKSGSVGQFTAFSADTANVSITAYNGDLTVIGNDSSSVAVSAIGDASANLNATGTLTLGDATHGIAVVTTGPDHAASLTAAGSGGLIVNGALSATASSGNADIELTSGAGLTVNSSATVQTLGANSAIALRAEEGNLALNGDLAALGLGAQIEVRADLGSLTQAAGSTVHAGAPGNASVDFFSGTGAMEVNGDIIAAATANGMLDGEHTGWAEVNLITASADGDISQGTTSTITAMGSSAGLTITAGKVFAGFAPADPTANFDLNGTLQAIDDMGGSTLDISGASGSVHDFTVTAGTAPATATITTYSGDLVLDGEGTVSGNYDSVEGAQLIVKAAGNLDTRAATLSVTNASVSNGAGASADLSTAGTSQLGALTVTAADLASLVADSTGAMTVSGALKAQASNGTANIALTSGAGLTVGSAASMAAQGHSSADIGLSSVNALVLDGDLTALGGSWADIVATTTGANASVTQGASSLVTVGGSHSASASFTSTGAMTINGDIVAAATDNGTANGDHTGSAYIALDTTGGATASITQGSGSAVSAVGSSARVEIAAGTSDPLANPSQAAAFDLNGSLQAIDAIGGSTLEISGASGSVHDFTVTAGNAPATATITAYTGNLVLDGEGTVSGNYDSGHGAQLIVKAAGALDASLASLSVGNASLGSEAGARAEFVASNGTNKIGAVDVGSSGGGLAEVIASGSAGLTVTDLHVSGDTASAYLTAATGAVQLGDIAISGSHGATLEVAAQHGSLSQMAGSDLTAAASHGAALIELSASDSLALRNASATGTSATLSAAAQHGTLTHAGNSVLTTSASGTATTQLSSGGAMNLSGNVLATSSGDSAVVDIDNGNAALTQGSNSLIRTAGVDATTAIQTGAMALGGTLQAQASTGTATLDINGGAGRVHAFDVASNSGAAHGQIVSSGALLLDGVGRVSGNSKGADGAALSIASAGALNQAGTLTVANGHTGTAAGAELALRSGGSLTNGAVLNVAANGGGAASMTLHAGGPLQINSNLTATAYNIGAGNGSAAIALSSGNQAGDAATIMQVATSKIVATSVGTNAGDASVDMQAGHCCDSTVQLLGATTASVASGAGDAIIGVRGNSIAVQGLTAKALGSGDTLISLAAPTQVVVNGLLTSTAAAPTATAGIQLVTDMLTYVGPKAALSLGNGRVQLAPFNTTWLIGVESEPDFDSKPQVHYTKPLLGKFTGNNAAIEFGGGYDRSAWIDANGNMCVPGMSEWADIGQHTGDIHVAGAGTGQFKLAASTMVFDTTGTTYYHDNAMSPWSVPTGRTAIYVPRPTPSLDRYLDRTENALQPAITGLESAAATRTFQSSAAVIVPEGATPIAGDMFMAGDGLNMTRLLSGGDTMGSGAGQSPTAQSPAAQSGNGEASNQSQEDGASKSEGEFSNDEDDEAADVI